MCYGDLLYKIRRVVGKFDFFRNSFKKLIINRYTLNLRYNDSICFQLVLAIVKESLNATE